jgi:hypothetical protein
MAKVVLISYYGQHYLEALPSCGALTQASQHAALRDCNKHVSRSNGGGKCACNSPMPALSLH